MLLKVTSTATIFFGLSYLLFGDRDFLGLAFTKFFELPWYLINDSNTLSFVVLGLNLNCPASSFSGSRGRKFIIWIGDLFLIVVVFGQDSKYSAFSRAIYFLLEIIEAYFYAFVLAWHVFKVSVEVATGVFHCVWNVIFVYYDWRFCYDHLQDSYIVNQRWILLF